MNRNATIPAVLALAALGLSACDRHEGQMVNANICTDFRATNAAQSAVPPTADAATPVDDCVKRWAYSLAGARDAADVVADAAVSACAAKLGAWNQTALGQQPQGGPPVEALSLTTGQPTTAMAEHAAFAHGRALLYAVQARAGRCTPPPATNGVLAGT